jgi:hypothetical protein
MRKLEVKEIRPGGVGAGVTAETVMVCCGNRQSGSVCTMAATAGTGNAPFSAWTYCCRDWDWQLALEAGWCARWQHPWAGWCDQSASKTCGQERQFPQSRASAINAAMIELEIACLKP